MNTDRQVIPQGGCDSATHTSYTSARGDVIVQHR